MSPADRYAAWAVSPRRRDAAFHLEALREHEAAAHEMITDYDRGAIGLTTLAVVRRQTEGSAARAITAVLLLWLTDDSEVP